MQKQLSRLAHRTDEQQESDHFECRQIEPEEADRRCRQAIHLTEDRREIDTVGQDVQRENAQDESEITDPVHDESLHRRSPRRGLAPVETDQKIGRHADALPAEEHL